MVIEGFGDAARRLGWIVAAGLALGLAGCGGSHSRVLDLGGAESDVAISATTGAFEVRVVDDSGAPVGGESVTVGGLASRQAADLALTTNGQGVVRAGNLPPGEYTLLIRGLRLSLPVRAGEVTVRRFNLGSPGSPQHSLGLLYVVNTLAKTLSVIDTVTGAVENNVLNTGEAPNQVAFLNGVGYVVNSVSNQVQRFNPATGAALAPIATGENTNPYSILFASASRAYVTNLIANEVAVVDLASGEVARTIPVSPIPEGMALANGRLFVCCTNLSYSDFSYGDGLIDVIDVASEQVIEQISLGIGANPQAAVVGADGLVYVVATGNYVDRATTVVRIDPATNQLVGDPLELVGDTPVSSGSLALAPNGLAFVADSNNDRLHVIDTRSGTVTRTGADALATGPTPLGIAASADGRVFVMNFGDDTVSVYDAATQAPIGQPLAVGDGPVTGGGRQARAAVGLAVR